MCSGKVYFDLLEERDARGINDIYLLRFEQFYPFPAMSAVKELERFQNAEMIWCQEEPKNQGAWSFMEPNIEWVLSRMNANLKDQFLLVGQQVLHRLQVSQVNIKSNKNYLLMKL